MTRDRYLEPYREAAARHGADFAVTLWANKPAQKLRFDVFVQMCHLEGKRIVDAGCSRGDFAAFLLEREVHFEHYVGIDGLDEVVEYAKGRRLERCDFVLGDFITTPVLLSVGDPQVIAISGSLNTMTDKQIAKVLEAAWEATSETLVFNFLPDLARPRAAHQTGPARRLDALRLLRWAAERTGHLAYRQDYFKHGHDGTIRMSKADPPPT